MNTRGAPPRDPLLRELHVVDEPRLAEARSREHDEDGVKAASAHVYEALTHHFGPRDLAANDPVVKALAEYGQACRDAGQK